VQPARRRDVAAERRGGRQDAKDELRLGPRLCLAAYRVPGWQVLEHRAVEIAKNESNPDANGTLQHLLGKRSWKWKWKRSGGLFNSGWDCDFDCRCFAMRYLFQTGNPCSSAVCSIYLFYLFSLRSTKNDSRSTLKHLGGILIFLLIFVCNKPETRNQLVNSYPKRTTSC